MPHGEQKPPDPGSLLTRPLFENHGFLETNSQHNQDMTFPKGYNHEASDSEEDDRPIIHSIHSHSAKNQFGNGAVGAHRLDHIFAASSSPPLTPPTSLYKLKNSPIFGISHSTPAIHEKTLAEESSVETRSSSAFDAGSGQTLWGRDSVHSHKHIWDEDSQEYPLYLRKASKDPIPLPPRCEWKSLHSTSQKGPWKRFLKKFKSAFGIGEAIETMSKNNRQDPSIKKIKTGWHLPGREPSVLLDYRLSPFSSHLPSFKVRPGRSLSFLRSVTIFTAPMETSQSSSYEGSEVSSDNHLSSMVSAPSRTTSQTNMIQFSNEYIRTQEGDWVYIQKDASQNVLGVYQIQGSYI